MYSNLKYGDACVCGYHNIINKLILKSNYINNGKILPDKSVTNKLFYCIECHSDSRFEIITVHSIVKVICLKCGFAHFRNVYDPINHIGEYIKVFPFNIKLINVKHCITFTQWYNTSYFKFRRDPISKTSKRKQSRSNGGCSTKGLIWSSYKNSFDEQCMNYGDNSETLKFMHMNSYKVYIDSGMDSFDQPHRDRPVRSWKRTKKRKQWM